MNRVVIVAVAACLVAATTAVALRTVEFHTVARSSGPGSTVTERTGLVVRDARAWRALWRRLQAGVIPRPATPKIDFSRDMLIAVTQGRQTNGGYSIRVKSIADDGRRLRVTAEERAPGRNCITPAVITAPYHVVRVRRSAKRAVFTRQMTVYDC